MLRAYQQLAIDQLYDWMGNHNGNPCLVLPTGAGKSHVVAALCKDAVQNWPETRILMLTHVKELIEQNAEKMLQHWPNAPMGIYSASIGKRQLGEPITFAGIQSVRNKANLLGHVDLIIIDECHLVSHKDEGGYRGLIDQLTQINPHLRVIGLTATPYRLGHGLITDKPAIFDGLIEPVTIPGLIEQGYLATLRSKVTTAKLSVDGVHKRGGEYIESELQAAVNTDPLNAAVVQEVIKLAGVRKSWLFFCAGIDHARNVAVMLNALGVPADVVTGDTSKKERAQIIADFKAGRLKALTNANVLTTGFDYPDIDLIAMLRPTLSPGLYVQMAGRGLRLKSHTDHCLVLDFAGVVARHGPIVAVEPPKKGGTGEGDAPIKVCEHCGEINHAAFKNCSNCGEAFPEPEPPPPKLHNDDIMGLEGNEMDVKEWVWRIHESRTSGKEMLTVTYYGRNLSDKPVTEYITILHEGYAGEKARRTLIGMAFQAGVQINPAGDLEDIVQQMTNAAAPAELIYRLDGKFYRVLGRNWSPKVMQKQLELV
ncbi:MAG: DEAD/DEAH box helicase [Pseudomonadota bacterium]